MTEELNNADVVESAKAVQETAKATNNAIDLARDTGGFFNRVFGGLVEDGVGVVADKVKYYRMTRAIELAEKVEAIHKVRGVSEETKAVSPKIAVPLIENATLEDDDELHNLWAALLANAMDPNSRTVITRNYVTILKELQVFDARILNILFEEFLRRHPEQYYSHDLSNTLFDKNFLKSITTEELEIEKSLLNLMRLSCIKPGVERQFFNSVIGREDYGSFGTDPKQYGGTDVFQLSVIGVELMKAVSNESKAKSGS